MLEYHNDNKVDLDMMKLPVPVQLLHVSLAKVLRLLYNVASCSIFKSTMILFERNMVLCFKLTFIAIDINMYVPHLELNCTSMLPPYWM